MPEQSMDEFGEFIHRNSRFLRPPFEAEYHSKTIVPSAFDPDRETIDYQFTVNGERKSFRSSSVDLLRQMQEKAQPGVTLRLSRKGTGTSTKYTVEVVE